MVAIAGPAVNILLAMGICFLPSFRDQSTCVYANLLIGIFNLIPVYPLDGGRVVKCVLRKFMSVKLAEDMSQRISVLSLSFFSVVGFIGSVYLRNFAISLIICYLWGIFVIERKRYILKRRVNEIISKV